MASANASTNEPNNGLNYFGAWAGSLSSLPFAAEMASYAESVYSTVPELPSLSNVFSCFSRTEAVEAEGVEAEGSVQMMNGQMVRTEPMTTGLGDDKWEGVPWIRADPSNPFEPEWVLDGLERKLNRKVLDCWGDGWEVARSQVRCAVFVLRVVCDEPAAGYLEPGSAGLDWTLQLDLTM
ncbi:hypothetical protein K432DRAFT_101368 [Lepidopterella palustris CBS 459.81]|uniref:Uncharacterized protein n=1 Tax=Lepidopterella palustris CBS 459.81 TaxID=1314670 RepID=A0A8E2E678_9PEZI|nr:hypothetical protein K432DRAFT_101368 [Lepidopterella palustris CBS 459.81]